MEIYVFFLGICMENLWKYVKIRWKSVEKLKIFEIILNKYDIIYGINLWKIVTKSMKIYEKL